MRNDKVVLAVIGLVVVCVASLAIVQGEPSSKNSKQVDLYNATAIISELTSPQRAMLSVMLDSKEFLDVLKASPEIRSLGRDASKKLFADLGKYVKISGTGGGKTNLVSVRVINMASAKVASTVARKIAAMIVASQEDHASKKLRGYLAAMQQQKKIKELKLSKLFATKNSLVRKYPEIAIPEGSSIRAMRMKVLVGILVESQIAAGVLKKEVANLKRMMVIRTDAEPGVVAAKLAATVALKDENILRAQLAGAQLSSLGEEEKHLAKIRLELDSISREEESLGQIIEKIDSNIVDVIVKLSTQTGAEILGVYTN